jgi:hypothetical protein
MTWDTGLDGDELVVAEERFEHGSGDEVLGEHPDGVFVPDGVVQVVAERFGERREACDCLRVLVGVGEQRTDTGFLGAAIWAMSSAQLAM